MTSPNIAHYFEPQCLRAVKKKLNLHKLPTYIMLESRFGSKFQGSLCKERSRASGEPINICSRKRIFGSHAMCLIRHGRPDHNQGHPLKHTTPYTHPNPSEPTQWSSLNVLMQSTLCENSGSPSETFPPPDIHSPRPHPSYTFKF